VKIKIPRKDTEKEKEIEKERERKTSENLISREIVYKYHETDG